MANYQITCITLSSNGTRNEHITHVGQINPKGRWPVATVVAWIKNKEHTFFVEDAKGKRAEVRVVDRDGLPSYLRTVADGYFTDNLLSLTSCAL